MSSKVAVIDYGAGNLRSVCQAFQYLEVDVEIVADPCRLINSSHLVLPGVGSFRRAMSFIRERNLDKVLPSLVKRGTPILGICLGMQLLASRSSEDGETLGLGLISGDVDRFSFDSKSLGLKIPHVGFNTVKAKPDSRLFAGLETSVDFYFTHSYRLLCKNANDVSATAFHGENFVASLEQGVIAGAQFHPEKSQANGLRLLSNFIQYF